MILSLGLATSAGPAQADEVTATVTVVDGKGKPFPAGTSGVLACDSDGSSAPCAVGVDDDGDGTVQIGLEPTVVYRVTGFAVDTGWPDPDYTDPGGTEFHFSDLIIVLGSELDGESFVIARPKHARATFGVDVTVVDGRGEPFPASTAGVMVCPADQPRGTCDPMIFGLADASGTAHVEIQPNVTYRVGALAFDTGWPCGGWTSPSGQVFFFSDEVVRTGAELSRPTTFVVEEPACA